MNSAIKRVTQLDRTIHQPARLLILTILFPVESADFVYLLRQTGLTKGNLGSHLAKLEKEQYIAIEKTYRGKVPLTICQMTEKGRAAFAAYRDHLRQIAAALPA